ncbi:MAG: GTPase HflX [Proteobacteria bacterium]|nr:GTPase HflX [Pseudomonadota bacterium]
MKFNSKPIEEHEEVPLPDEGRWETLVAHWTQREAPAQPDADSVNACYVVAVGLWKQSTSRDAQLSEIVSLVQAQGDRVVGQEAYRLVKPDPRTLIRSGVADRIGARATECGADLLVVDADLTPSQTRNLEDATGLAVCDREAVILNVFQRHAKTRRARIQVEIAHLEYLRPRIRGIGLNMDQQAGGMMRVRGSGETASELLARRLDGRLADLRNALDNLRQSDNIQRRHRSNCSRIALVGYTNAGKTSLMNALTASDLSARDRLFETLDTTSRCLTRHGGDVILSDTVGFIRRLPKRLFASFESTLAEVREASLLLLVVDVADPECALQLQTTEDLLVKLAADAIPRFYVFNKTDLLEVPASPADLHSMSRGHEYLALSSRDQHAVARLRRALLAAARRKQQARRVFVPYQASAVTNTIYARCRVVEAKPSPHGMQFVIEGDPHLLEQLARASEEESLS